MKTKFIIISAFALIVLITINSCKKGEDDPWLSLRSRDNRVIGTWVLEEYEVYTKENSLRNKTNNVTNDYSKTKKHNSIKEKFTNSLLTITSIDEYIVNTRVKYWDFEPINYTDTVFLIDDISERYDYDCSIDKYTYKIELEIRKNNTWIATYERTNISFQRISDSYRIMNSDTTSSGGYNNTSNSNNTYKWEEEGSWNWEDSNKNKIIINAGPMKGYIKRLSHKEIIIEESNTNNKQNAEFSTGNIWTYIDPSNTDSSLTGTYTTNYTETDLNTKYYKWVAK